MSDNGDPPPVTAMSVLGPQKIDRFDVEDPIGWFGQYEDVLEYNGVQSADWFRHLKSCLHARARKPITLQLNKPPENAEKRYEWLKELLIAAHTSSRHEKFKQLMEKEKIGDRKPSAFLSHLRELAPPTVNDEFVIDLWKLELPPEVQTALYSMAAKDTDEMARHADVLWDMIGKRHSNQISATSSIPQTTPLQKIQEDLATILQKFDKINARLNDVERRINKPRNTIRHRSQSRPRNDRSGGADSSNVDHCYYHNRFGEMADKCRSPCKFTKN